MKPTQDRLKELFLYCPETGILSRRVRRGPVAAGRLAGSMNGDGYLQVMVDGRIYLVHHVVWAYETGKWPRDQIDHINRSRADNRVVNLREVSAADNMKNRNRQRNNTSGVIGVNFGNGKWRAEINADGKRHYLGSFADKRRAAAVRAEAEARLHRIGEPSRYTA